MHRSIDVCVYMHIVSLIRMNQLMMYIRCRIDQHNNSVALEEVMENSYIHTECEGRNNTTTYFFLE